MLVTQSTWEEFGFGAGMLFTMGDQVNPACIMPRDSQRRLPSVMRSAERLRHRHSGFAHGKARVMAKTLSAIELCSGAGGLSLGLEAAKIKPIALIDNDSHACATLRKNRPYWNTIEADLRRFDLSQWKGVDLVSGGLPCPPYSFADKRRGSDDERDLFPDMLRIVGAVAPRGVLVENVPGLLHSKFDGVRNRVARELSRLGFESHWRMLNASDFSTPQNRSRVFLVALRKGEANPLEWPSPVMGQGLTVGETLGDLMASNGWEGSSDWIRNASQIAPTIVGGSKKHGGPDLGPTRARRQWAEIGVDGLGIANQPPPPGFKGLPRLTARMVARIQGFPDSWIFSGGKTQQCRQIGNALPPPLAAAVARALAKCLG